MYDRLIVITINDHYIILLLLLLFTILIYSYYSYYSQSTLNIRLANCNYILSEAAIVSSEMKNRKIIIATVIVISFFCC